MVFIEVVCEGWYNTFQQTITYLERIVSNMDKRPEFGKYRTLVSGIIISIFAAILLFAGVVVLIGGLINNKDGSIELAGYYGLGCIVLSAFLFIISSIAEDIHYQRYLKDFDVDEAIYYHTQSLQRLESIERLLMNQQYQMPTQNNYTGPIPELQYMQPQYETEPEPEEAEKPAPDKKVRYKEKTPKQHEVESYEDDSFDYKAQYKRPESK